MECKTTTLGKTVRIADANDKPIFVGSVLKSLEDGTVGVVTRILEEGDTHVPPASCEGDLNLWVDHGITRITNRYYKWEHVPRAEQTYEQRLRAWRSLPSYYDPENPVGIDEGEHDAIQGILALLPSDPVDWENGPWPDRLEDALEILKDHLEDMEFRANNMDGLSKGVTQ